MIPFSFWRKVTPQTNLWVWGLNAYGQLGTGNTTTYSSPVQVPGSWLQVTSAGTGVTGTAFSLGIQTNGTLWAWGDNTYGELGQGTHGATTSVSSPVQIAGSWIQTSCGGDWGNPFSLAIRADHSLWGWGDGSGGNLGQNNTTSYSSPVQIMPGTSWTCISAAVQQWLGIQANGTLWACGEQGAGELGVGTATTSYSSPVQIGGSWTQVAISVDSSPGSFAGGIKADGSLWMWGGNGSGDLGLGNSTVMYSSPVQLSSASWIQLALSNNQAFAIRSDNTLWGWGGNGYGELGVGTTVPQSSPVQVPGQWRHVFTSETNTSSFTLAIRTTGTLWGWGYDQEAQLGTGTTGNYSSPIQVGGKTWASINGGSNTSMGLM